MPKAIVVALLALLATPASGAGPPEEAESGRLTPEEAAAGWVQLFDGRDASGLRVEGDVELTDDVLVIGGAGPARLGVKRELGEDFELRLFYRTEGPGRLNFRSESHGLMSGAESGTSVPEPPSVAAAPPEWHELRCRCQRRRDGDGYDIVLESWREGRVVDSNRGGGLGLGGSPPAVWFEVPAGSKLLLRGAKARPDPAAGRSWKSPWGFGAILLAALFGVVVAVLLLARRMRRRAPALAAPREPSERQSVGPASGGEP